MFCPNITEAAASCNAGKISVPPPCPAIPPFFSWMLRWNVVETDAVATLLHTFQTSRTSTCRWRTCWRAVWTTRGAGSSTPVKVQGCWSRTARLWGRRRRPTLWCSPASSAPSSGSLRAGTRYWPSPQRSSYRLNPASWPKLLCSGMQQKFTSSSQGASTWLEESSNTLIRLPLSNWIRFNGLVTSLID